MTLIEALANKSEIPCTIVNSPYWNGRQYRWYNGRIQTRTPTGRWHRTINIPILILETAEVSDSEIL